jgi:hypothetical protein
VTVQFFTQPPFDARLYNSLAFPLTNSAGGSTTLQRGSMIWDQPLPGYSQRAYINYLFNPSTVASDFAMSNTSAQAAQLYPNPGDNAYMAIPISQTAQWTLLFDRTYEVQGSYNSSGLPANGGNNALDAETLGVQADVMAFMQFTGMFFNNGKLPSAVEAANTNLAANSGIMMQVPSWAYFGNQVVTNGLMYYGFINEFSVQYTHWTQYNVPFRAVISVNWTMLSMPGTQPPSPPATNITSLLNGSASTPTTANLGNAGIGGT